MPPTRLAVVVATTLAAVLALCSCTPPQTVGRASGGVDAADVHDAVVTVHAVGGYVAPGASTESDRTGTGFLTSADGAVITASQVVQGAASVTVEIDGREVKAVVSGTSECAGLALLLAQTGEVPYLRFRKHRVIEGLPVTLITLADRTSTTVVSRSYLQTASVSGEEGFVTDITAAATTAGAPIVDDTGSVAGVVVSGGDGVVTAVSGSSAQSIARSLSATSPYRSLGLLIQPILGSVVSGVRVDAVVTGSPAAHAGLVPGDVILAMAGVDIGGDATLGGYCQALDDAGPQGVIPLTVFRGSTGEVLRGAIRGTELAAAD